MSRLQTRLWHNRKKKYTKFLKKKCTALRSALSFHELHFHLAFSVCLFVLFLFGSSIVGAEGDASRGSSGTSLDGGGGSVVSHDASPSRCEYIKQYCQENYAVSDDQSRWRECLENKLKGTDIQCPDIVEKLRWLKENDQIHERTLQYEDDTHDAVLPAHTNELLLERLHTKLSSLSRSERLCAEELQQQKKERCHTSSVPFCAEQAVLRALEDGECRMASGGGQGFHSPPSQNVMMEKKVEPQPPSVARSPAAILGEMVTRVFDLLERMPEGAEKERVRAIAGQLGALVGRSASEGIGAVMPDIKTLMDAMRPYIGGNGRGLGSGMNNAQKDQMSVKHLPQERIRTMLDKADAMMEKLPDAFRRMREKGYTVEGWKEKYAAIKTHFAQAREMCRNAMSADDAVAIQACLHSMRDVFEGKMQELEILASQFVPHDVMNTVGREMGFKDDNSNYNMPPPAFKDPSHNGYPQPGSYDGYMGPPVPIYDSPRDLIPEGAMERFDPPEHLTQLAEDCFDRGGTDEECHREVMDVMMQNMFACMKEGRSEQQCRGGMIEDFGGNADEDMHYFEE